MVKKFRKRAKHFYLIKKPIIKEKLYTQTGNIPLNIAQTDRISFSVLRNDKNDLRKIENISYEINIDNSLEWIVRYDDHGGTGSLHRHIRISLKDNRSVESTDGIRRYKNKNYELTWACNDIKKNYLRFRKNFLKHSGLNLY